MYKKISLQKITLLFALLIAAFITIYFILQKQKEDELSAIRKTRFDAEKFAAESRKTFDFINQGVKYNNLEITQEEYDRAKKDFIESADRLNQKIESVKKTINTNKDGN